MTGYAELQVTSNFSSLRGASHPEEYVEAAFNLGYKTIGITDRNTLSGVVRAHVLAKANGLKSLTGVRLDLLDGPSLLAYPTSKDAGTTRLKSRPASIAPCALASGRSKACATKR